MRNIVAAVLLFALTACASLTPAAHHHGRVGDVTYPVAPIGGGGNSGPANLATATGQLTSTSQLPSTGALPAGLTTAGGSALVGAADTQTLTNKSIAATQLTGALQAAQEPAHTGGCTNTAGSLALTCSPAALSAGALASGVTTNGGSAPVGTADTQTLTGKTMSGASNTFTNVPTSALASGALPAGVTLPATGMPAITGDASSTAGTAVLTIGTGVVTDAKASLAIKPAAQLVAVTALTLSGAQTIDGVLGTAGSTIVLATAQTIAANNGPWVMQSGAWTRPAWFVAGGTTQAFHGAQMTVQQGAAYQGSVWFLSTSGAITIGTTAQAWTLISETLNALTSNLPTGADCIGTDSNGNPIGCGLQLPDFPLLPAYSFYCNPTASPAIPQACAATPGLPGGRLTLDSANAVQVSDKTAQTTLYYLAYNGQTVPVYNGTQFVAYTISSPSLSTANSTNFPASKAFDVYAFVNSGSLTLCAVQWTSTTSRGTSAAIAQLNGIWTNSGAWTCLNGATSYTLTTSQATLLGTFVTTATAQQMAFQMTPAAATGGPAGGCWMGYANLYNQVPVSCRAADSGTNFSSTVTTWEAYDVGNSSGLNNRISWVDPIGSINYEAEMPSQGKTGTAGTYVFSAIGINSVTAPTGSVAAFGIATSGFSLAVATGPSPGAGLNFAQALDESQASVTATFVPNGTVSSGAGNQVETLKVSVRY